MRAIAVKPPEPGAKFLDMPMEKEKNLLKIRTVETGICGTDREIVRGSLSFVRPEQGEYLILGHEALGKVEESIDESMLREGDFVIPMVRRPGKCRMCKIGRQDYCIDKDFVEAGIRGKNGFMKDLFFEKEQFLVKVWDKNIASYAVLVEPLKNIMKIKEVFEQFRKRILWDCEDSTLECKGAWIFGTGTEGLLSAMVFRSMGLKVSIVNRHPIPDRVRSLLDSNNIMFFNSSSDSWDESIKEVSMDLVIDAVGSADILKNSIEKINNNGIIILFGTAAQGALDQNNGEFITKIVDKNLSIAGCEDGAKQHYIEAVQFLEAYGNRYSLNKMITDRFEPEHLEILTKKPEAEIKSTFKWS